MPFLLERKVNLSHLWGKSIHIELFEELFFALLAVFHTHCLEDVKIFLTLIFRFMFFDLQL